jgi:hypothetical protein
MFEPVKHGRFAIALALSMLLPIALLIANSIHFGQPWVLLGSSRFLLGNWLYMGFPQLLWGVLALVFVRRLLRVRIVALLALDALLTCFQVWIWYAVAGRDGADAWILYIPLWIAVIVVAFFIGWTGARRDSSQ